MNLSRRPGRIPGMRWRRGSREPAVEARPGWAHHRPEDSVEHQDAATWTRKSPADVSDATTPPPSDPPNERRPWRDGKPLRLVAPALLVVASLAAGLLGGNLAGDDVPTDPEASDPTTFPTATGTASASAGGVDFTGIYNEVAPAVVLINTNQRRGSALGSGVITDAANGIIITNNHVVPENQGLTVILSDGTELDAFVLGRQPTQDLAVVQIVNPPADLPAARLGDAASLQIGEPVAAIGAPFALRGTLTTGVISALNRVFPGNRDVPRIEGLIQTDAAINPGNSGGPLINAFGEVVGINTAIESPIQGSVGIGFAVPIETVRRVLAAIANRV